jgi:hypothetical protein
MGARITIRSKQDFSLPRSRFLARITSGLPVIRPELGDLILPIARVLAELSGDFDLKATEIEDEFFGDNRYLKYLFST